MSQKIDSDFLPDYDYALRARTTRFAHILTLGVCAFCFIFLIWAHFAKLDEAVVPHALRHMAAVGVAWLGYAVALYLRRDALSGADTLGSISLALSLASALLLALGGWLGGRLVYTFGAGVDAVRR